MTEKIDKKLSQLKTLEDSIKKLEEEKVTLREEVFSTLETENLSNYKSDIATISMVERKSVKYITKPEVLINELEDQYVDVIPEEVIAEHKEINKSFTEAVKNGIKFAGVELEVKENLAIRFVK